MAGFDDIASIVARHEAIAAAWVFGSVARGDARPDSDLDVAVLLRPGVAEDTNDLLGLTGELEVASPSGKVDIVVLGPQGAVFRHRVLAEGRLVHDADRDTRIAFEERVTRDYLDWKPTHDIAMRSVFQGLARRFGANT